MKHCLYLLNLCPYLDLGLFIRLPLKPGPRSWTKTKKKLDPEKLRPPEKPGPKKHWKHWKPEKHWINMTLKSLSYFRELFFIKIMRNVICCLKFVYLDI